jgi:hypothetical protein
MSSGKGYTHIRPQYFPGMNLVVRLCGATEGETIGYEHYKERLTNPAIDGQLGLLPNPLCKKCIDIVDWVKGVPGY